LPRVHWGSVVVNERLVEGDDPLTQQRWRALLACVAEIYGHQDVDSFAARIMQVCRATVGADFAVYDEIHLRRQRHKWISDPPELDLSAASEAHEYLFKEHPFVLHLQRTGDVPPLRLSDFLSRRQYHSTGLYHEAYRRFGVEYQLGFTLPSPSPAWSVGLAFSRSRPDFSDEERLIFELLRPHLFQAYCNAELMTQLRETATHATHALESARQAIVTIDARGRIRWWSPLARRWLAEYFGRFSCAGGKLPDTLRRWLHQHRLPGIRATSIPRPREPLVLERNGRRLTVRILSDEGSCQTLAIEEQRTLSAEPLRALGVTARQAEILLWVMQGKTNPEIGTILGLSPRTVHKHTEHIYARLGVETRTAAAARAWESMAVDRVSVDGRSDKEASR
jgi:DNA-binding CsgD family transcriptional regulator